MLFQRQDLNYSFETLILEVLKKNQKKQNRQVLPVQLATYLSKLPVDDLPIQNPKTTSANSTNKNKILQRSQVFLQIFGWALLFCPLHQLYVTPQYTGMLYYSYPRQPCSFL